MLLSFYWIYTCKDLQKYCHYKCSEWLENFNKPTQACFRSFLPVHMTLHYQYWSSHGTTVPSHLRVTAIPVPRTYFSGFHYESSIFHYHSTHFIFFISNKCFKLYKAFYSWLFSMLRITLQASMTFVKTMVYLMWQLLSLRYVVFLMVYQGFFSFFFFLIFKDFVIQSKIVYHVFFHSNIATHNSPIVILKEFETPVLLCRGATMICQIFRLFYYVVIFSTSSFRTFLSKFSSTRIKF